MFLISKVLLQPPGSRPQAGHGDMCAAAEQKGNNLKGLWFRV